MLHLKQEKTFADVAGQDEAKEALWEVIDFLHNPQKIPGNRGEDAKRDSACRTSGDR